MRVVPPKSFNKVNGGEEHGGIVVLNNEPKNISYAFTCVIKQIA